MPGSGRSRSKPRTKFSRKEGWVKPEEEDLSNDLNTGFDDEGIKERRVKHQPTALAKTSMRDGHVIRGPISKRTLSYEDEHVKIPTGKRDTTTLNHRRTRLRRLSNPSYRKPTPPKKKSCCQRWFGRDAGKKKCKKKCKTRKKKKKNKTRKKERRRRKKKKSKKRKK